MQQINKKAQLVHGGYKRQTEKVTHQLTQKPRRI